MDVMDAISLFLARSFVLCVCSVLVDCSGCVCLCVRLLLVGGDAVSFLLQALLSLQSVFFRLKFFGRGSGPDRSSASVSLERGQAQTSATHKIHLVASQHPSVTLL